MTTEGYRTVIRCKPDVAEMLRGLHVWGTTSEFEYEMGIFTSCQRDDEYVYLRMNRSVIDWLSGKDIASDDASSELFMLGNGMLSCNPMHATYFIGEIDEVPGMLKLDEEYESQG